MTTSSRLLTMMIAAAAGLLIVAFLFLWQMIPGSTTPTPSTEPQATDTDYSSLIAQLTATGLVDHFPATLGSDPESTVLFYQPDELGSGLRLQLRQTVSAEEAESLWQRYQPLAIRQYTGGDVNQHVADADGLPTTFFYTADSQEEFSFPDSYQILVLDAAIADGAAFPWEHGYSYGLAIDLQESEIVYWLEQW